MESCDHGRNSDLVGGAFGFDQMTWFYCKFVQHSVFSDLQNSNCDVN